MASVIVTGTSPVNATGTDALGAAVGSAVGLADGAEDGPATAIELDGAPGALLGP